MNCIPRSVDNCIKPPQSKTTSVIYRISLVSPNDDRNSISFSFYSFLFCWFHLSLFSFKSSLMLYSCLQVSCQLIGFGKHWVKEHQLFRNELDKNSLKNSQLLNLGIESENKTVETMFLSNMLWPRQESNWRIIKMFFLSKPIFGFDKFNFAKTQDHIAKDNFFF